MCRILVAPENTSDLSTEKIRMFRHLLGLSVELEQVSSRKELSGRLSASPRVDILIVGRADSGDENALRAYLASRNGDVSVITLSEKATRVERTEDGAVLPTDWNMKDFYDVLLLLSPRTISSVSPEVFDRKWYGNNSELQQRVLDVVHIIRDEYDRDLSLDYLARNVYSSPCYLSSLFRKFMGTTFLSYLNEYRMEQAARYLSETGMPLSAISEKVGYRNLPYFCTSFKHAFGCTPSQFRMQAS